MDFSILIMSRTFSSFDLIINVFHNNRIFKKLSIYFRLCRFSQASAPACSSARDKLALVSEEHFYEDDNDFDEDEGDDFYEDD